jgi:Tfp pilus assembly protein PilF
MCGSPPPSPRSLHAGSRSPALSAESESVSSLATERHGWRSLDSPDLDARAKALSEITMPHHASRSQPTATDAGARPASRRRWTAARHVFALILLPALTWALYARALNAPLFFDDQTAIVFNPNLQHLHPMTKFLYSNRPLTEFSFALNYARAGSAPQEYHLGNIIVHAVNGLLVYALVNQILGTPALAASYGAAAPVVGVAAAALFLAHPLQTETAAYVSSRSESLAALFYLLTVLVYGLAATRQRRLAQLAWGVALPVTAAAALASKEMAATIPAALVLYDCCFISRGSWRRLRTRWPLFAVLAIPFVLGLSILMRRDLLSPTAGFNFGRFSGREYLFTQFGVIFHYLRLTLVPVGLCMDTEWPLQRTLWSPEVLVPLVALAALSAVAVANVRRRPVLAFAVLWILVVLAPTSSVIPIADLVAERRMYLALVGPALLAAAWIWNWTGRIGWLRAHGMAAQGPAFMLLLAVPVAILSVLTLARVRVWLDPITLYEDGVAKAPDNPRARLNLAAAYLFRNRLDPAQTQLEEAERLFERGQSVQAFDRVGAYINLNLCNLLYHRQQYDEATRRCMRALRLGGGFVVLRSMAFLHLGQIAGAQRQWPEAIAYYQQALPYASPGIRLHILLHIARTYMLSGQFDLARQNLQLVLHDDPRNPEATAMMRTLDALPQ